MTILAGLGVLFLRLGKLLLVVAGLVLLAATFPLVFGIMWCDSLGEEVLGRNPPEGCPPSQWWGLAWAKGTALWAAIAAIVAWRAGWFA